MSLLISHMSAMDFWRLAYPTDKSPDPADCVCPQGRCLCTEEDVWSTAPPLFTPRLLDPERQVLHITVRNRRDRHASRTHRCHLWQSDIPDGAFFQLSDDAFVSSPQFAFLQLAQTLTTEQLIMLADELCGLYSFDSQAPFGIRQRTVPLTNVKSLGNFLSQAAATAELHGSAPLRGARKALRALEHAIENSASPRETILEMLLSLPCRMGGYGLPRPEMNAEIPLSPKAAQIAGRNRLRADLYWRKALLDLEFNGRDPHSGTDSEFSDRARTNALEVMGYTVREITHQQLDNQGPFETVALHIAGMLGKRVRAEQRGASPQRTELRQSLLAWNQASGRPR